MRNWLREIAFIVYSSCHRDNRGGIPIIWTQSIVTRTWLKKQSWMLLGNIQKVLFEVKIGICVAKQRWWRILFFFLTFIVWSTDWFYLFLCLFYVLLVNKLLISSKINSEFIQKIFQSFVMNVCFMFQKYIKSHSANKILFLG